MSDLDVNVQLTPTTQDATLATWIAALVAVNIPADKWRKGGTARNILRVVAATYAAIANLIVLVVGAGFLETAVGVWLTFLAYYVFGVVRPAATYASGPLTITNSGGGLYGPFAAGELIVKNTNSKKTYQNTTSITINPGATLTGLIFSARESGSASTSVATTIDAFVTPLNGVTVTNPNDVVGLDAMGDDDLKTLCTNKRGASSPNGPRDSYAYAARTATNPLSGAPVNINRIAITRSSSTGTVGIVVASPSGVPDPNDVLGVINNIEATSRPDTVTVNTSGCSATASVQAVNVWAKQTAGVDAAAIQSAVLARISKIVSAYDIGGINKPPLTVFNLWASDLVGEAKAAHPSIFAVDGFTDIPLIPGQVATLALTVTVSIVAGTAA